MKSQRQKPLHGGMETPCWLQLRNKVICYFPDLREDIFILHHQRVGVHVSGEQVLSVTFCAPLGSALDILRPWREAKGNQSEVNYSHLPSWCTLHSPELHSWVHKLNLLGPEAGWTEEIFDCNYHNTADQVWNPTSAQRYCKVQRALAWKRSSWPKQQ